MQKLSETEVIDIVSTYRNQKVHCNSEGGDWKLVGTNGNIAFLERDRNETVQKEIIRLGKLDIQPILYPLNSMTKEHLIQWGKLEDGNIRSESEICDIAWDSSSVEVTCRWIPKDKDDAHDDAGYCYSKFTLDLYNIKDKVCIFLVAKGYDLPICRDYWISTYTAIELGIAVDANTMESLPLCIQPQNETLEGSIAVASKWWSSIGMDGRFAAIAKYYPDDFDFYFYPYRSDEQIHDMWVSEVVCRWSYDVKKSFSKVEDMVTEYLASVEKTSYVGDGSNLFGSVALAQNAIKEADAAIGMSADEIKRIVLQEALGNLHHECIETEADRRFVMGFKKGFEFASKLNKKQ